MSRRAQTAVALVLAALLALALAAPVAAHPGHGKDKKSDDKHY